MIFLTKRYTSEINISKYSEGFYELNFNKDLFNGFYNETELAIDLISTMG